MAEFLFKTKLDQTLLLGRKARNASELLDGLREVPGSCIYFHTHRFLLQHHFLSPEPPNDFAYWASNVLNDALLGEQLWSVDVIQFKAIAELRKALIALVEKHIADYGSERQAPPGGEFHFMASRTFVLPTRFSARSLAEFRHILRDISLSSIYFHMFDARLRLEAEENDFSAWFRSMGKEDLAGLVAKLDPYRYTLEGLRKRILVLAERYDKD